MSAGRDTGEVIATALGSDEYIVLIPHQPDPDRTPRYEVVAPAGQNPAVTYGALRDAVHQLDCRGCVACR